MYSIDEFTFEVNVSNKSIAIYYLTNSALDLDMDVWGLCIKLDLQQLCSDVSEYEDVFVHQFVNCKKFTNEFENVNICDFGPLLLFWKGF